MSHITPDLSVPIEDAYRRIAPLLWTQRNSGPEPAVSGGTAAQSRTQEWVAARRTG